MRSVTAIVLICTSSISVTVIQQSNVSAFEYTDAPTTGSHVWRELAAPSARLLANVAPRRDLLPQLLFDDSVFSGGTYTDSEGCSEATLPSKHDFVEDIGGPCEDADNSFTTLLFDKPGHNAGALIHGARSIPAILLASEESLDPGVLWFLTRNTQIDKIIG